MSDKPKRSLVPRSGGFFQDIGMNLKLIVRLLRDRRVSPLVKLLPVGSLLYLVVPDLAPTPIDDAAVIWLGSVLFVELCPADVVQEHRDALRSVVDGEWREVEERKPPPQVDDRS
ncbi:MAG TPA: hypothetical protein VFJ45_06390 [bacterium]|nr:hypothetical protein [bacterium]